MAAFRRGRLSAVPELLDQARDSTTATFEGVLTGLYRAELTYGMGDLAGTEAAAQEVVDRDRYEFEGWFWLGVAQAEAGRVADAAQTLADGRAALADAKNALGPGELDNLEAVVAAASGDHARAQRILEGCRRRPTALRHRDLENLATARVAEAGGDHAAAIAAWGLVLEPDHLRSIMSLDFDVWPLYDIGRLEHDHGDHARARTALRRFLGYWGEADRSLPSIEDARRRLAELGDG